MQLAGTKPLDKLLLEISFEMQVFNYLPSNYDFEKIRRKLIDLCIPYRKVTFNLYGNLTYEIV